MKNFARVGLFAVLASLVTQGASFAATDPGATFRCSTVNNQGSFSFISGTISSAGLQADLKRTLTDANGNQTTTEMHVVAEPVESSEPTLISFEVAGTVIVSNFVGGSSFAKATFTFAKSALGADRRGGMTEKGTYLLGGKVVEYNYTYSCVFRQ